MILQCPRMNLHSQALDGTPRRSAPTPRCPSGRAARSDSRRRRRDHTWAAFRASLESQDQHLPRGPGGLIPRRTRITRRRRFPPRQRHPRFGHAWLHPMSVRSLSWNDHQGAQELPAGPAAGQPTTANVPAPLTVAHHRCLGSRRDLPYSADSSVLGSRNVCTSVQVRCGAPPKDGRFAAPLAKLRTTELTTTCLESMFLLSAC